jgi:hypothetical protein
MFLFSLVLRGVLRAGNFRNRVFDGAVASAMKSDPSKPRVTLHDLDAVAEALNQAVPAAVVFKMCSTDAASESEKA